MNQRTARVQPAQCRISAAEPQSQNPPFRPPVSVFLVFLHTAQQLLFKRTGACVRAQPQICAGRTCRLESHTLAQAQQQRLPNPAYVLATAVNNCHPPISSCVVRRGAFKRGEGGQVGARNGERMKGKERGGRRDRPRAARRALEGIAPAMRNGPPPRRPREERATSRPVQAIQGSSGPCDGVLRAFVSNLLEVAGDGCRNALGSRGRAAAQAPISVPTTLDRQCSRLKPCFVPPLGRRLKAVAHAGATAPCGAQQCGTNVRVCAVHAPRTQGARGRGRVQSSGQGLPPMSRWLPASLAPAALRGCFACRPSRRPSAHCTPLSDAWLAFRLMGGEAMR